MIIMMIYHDVFFLLKKGFGSQKEKKLSLFRRALPTKTLHTLPRASRASPREKNLAFLMALDGGNTGRFLIENLVIFMIIS